MMRVLVCAASRYGATAEIAARIAERLREAGVDTELGEPDAVSTLDGYDAVVLGSSVSMGRWCTSARALADRFAADLAARPLWLFSSGPVGDPLFPPAEPAEAAALAETLGAREHRVLPGKVDRSVLGAGDRLVMRTLRASEGDFRDWGTIEAWAADIARTLQTTTAA